MEEKKLFRPLALIGVLGALAVALGALGAHALRGKMNAGFITPEQLGGFETAVRYHMYHVLAMLGVLLLRRQFDLRAWRLAFIFFGTGILLFSGSLYLLCTRQLFDAPWLSVLGPVTPLGGLFLICGWIFLCLPLFNKR